MFDFNDKVVVVTGGAQGIGKCIRQSFEAAGQDLLQARIFVLTAV